MMNQRFGESPLSLLFLRRLVVQLNLGLGPLGLNDYAALEAQLGSIWLPLGPP